MRAEDVVGVLVANAVLIVGMWIRHGGLDELGTVSGVAIAAGQLATYLALVQLLLMPRATCGA